MPFHDAQLDVDALPAGAQRDPVRVPPDEGHDLVSESDRKALRDLSQVVPVPGLALAGLAAPRAERG